MKKYISKRHIIDININNLEPKVFKFIKSLIRLYDRYGISLQLLNRPHVGYGNSTPNGQWLEDDFELQVACKRPFKFWLEVLVHESCHVDQYLEECASWSAVENAGDPYLVLDLWLDNDIEMTPEQLKKCVKLIQWHELDCEKRTVAKIKDWGLPLDSKECTQHANSYIYFYTMMQSTRKWYRKGRGPYEIKMVTDAMPDKFLSLEEYLQVEPALISLYNKHVF